MCLALGTDDRHNVQIDGDLALLPAADLQSPKTLCGRLQHLTHGTFLVSNRMRLLVHQTQQTGPPTLLGGFVRRGTGQHLRALVPQPNVQVVVDTHHPVPHAADQPLQEQRRQRLGGRRKTGGTPAGSQGGRCGSELAQPATSDGGMQFRIVDLSHVKEFPHQPGVKLRARRIDQSF